MRAILRPDRWWQVPAIRTATFLLIAFLGGASLAYPSAAEWIGAVGRSQTISHYGETTTRLTPEQRAALLEAAARYNGELTDSPLSDPFLPSPDGPVMGSDAGRKDYEKQLRAGESDGPMARLMFPAIDVDLPIFHGTANGTLARGAGHLYGSSLPVGGRGTHSVITAHNGYTGAEMFDDLDAAQLGDTFTITVAGKVLTYRVDQIEVVTPDELDHLLQVPGSDYVTLVTCTPRFINSDRLLVRGTRVGTGWESQAGGDLEPDSAAGPGMPWWVVVVALPPALAAGLLWVTNSARKRSTALPENPQAEKISVP
ncbi:class C sortase [Agreia sp. VKM Ac-1783]|uniref:class C sortase n=1 Tax=Agreia sp. VKM Ac-1783 TaxID=1938889 RepID=UPI000A2AAC78|nr:class C sortase [Agreia sp. VKM Ac-1783]SMQ68387.1 sortase A [Agreia sp. VKM Ac-1783]